MKTLHIRHEIVYIPVVIIGKGSRFGINIQEAVSTPPRPGFSGIGNIDRIETIVSRISAETRTIFTISEIMRINVIMSINLHIDESLL